MVDVSGIPNMGFGGGGYFGGSSSLGLPAMSADQINASMGYNPYAAQYNPWANTPGGFGGQTDYYSALGAAYGRGTGGFGGGGGGGGYPSGQVDYGGGLQDIPWTDPFSQGAAPSGGGNPYAQMYRMPDANPSYFNPSTYAGDQGNYGLPYNGRGMPGDVGFSAQQQMPNLGYNPGMANYFANQGMSGGGFQERFGMGFPNAGTPSQYYTGSNYGGGGGMPPGFSGTYGVDSPGGALPLNPFTNTYGVGNSQSGG